jgi:hypothetical protein
LTVKSQLSALTVCPHGGSTAPGHSNRIGIRC